MKKIIFCILSVFVGLLYAGAQEYVERMDSIELYRVHYIDSTIVGSGLSSMMPSNVKVERSSEIDAALRAHISENENKLFGGYRIRIFFDNSQAARKESETVLNKFKSSHPEVAVQRTFVNPYFKVTVGEYRTRSEALAALRRYQSEFPSAFIVRENFRYPAL